MPASPHVAQQEFHKPTVLIVEDEPLIRVDVAEHLRDGGFRVLEATNADEAIATLSIRYPDFEIDAVFTDVRMPGPRDGLALARWIRTNRPELPVLLGSGHMSEADLARELLREEKLVAKPYRFEEVLRELRGLMGRQP